MLGAGGVDKLVKEITEVESKKKKKNAGFADRKPEVKNLG